MPIGLVLLILIAAEMGIIMLWEIGVIVEVVRDLLRDSW